uniref:Secreted peptide prohormone 19 n=1 Tax=Schmidtea mediterranea TaxID=79327 RepID=E3T7U8_SCHMD|nr:secreted peptide prohormone 19 [Schmidtea mediterranea]
MNGTVILCTLIVLLASFPLDGSDDLIVKRKHIGHQIFRLKRGYHFFRLRKDEKCLIPGELKSAIKNDLESGSNLCGSDKSFLAELASLL